MTITGLSASTTYYFAMKTLDEVPNTSGLSNVPSAATITAVTPAVQFAAATSSGAESVTSVSLPVNLSVASGSTVTVGYAVTGGTATGSGTDFTLVTAR